MPLCLNSLANIIFSIIIINIFFYILLILRPSKKLESLFYFIVSGYQVIIIKFHDFLIQSGIIKYNNSEIVPKQARIIFPDFFSLSVFLTKPLFYNILILRIIPLSYLDNIQKGFRQRGQYYSSFSSRIYLYIGNQIFVTI